MAGRRAGSPDTRGEIVAAASKEFAEKGISAASFRGIARRAGVDARLVHHYFDSKVDLFFAGLELERQPHEMLQQALDVPRDQLGEAAIRFLLGIWDRPEIQPKMIAMLKSAASDEEVATIMRRGFVEAVVMKALRNAGATSDRGAALAITQLIGLIFVRYVVKLGPIADMTVDELAESIGPNVQRYLDL